MRGTISQPNVGGVYAVLDACVLIPARLSDMLFDLALQNCFQPLWTADIEAEFLKNWTLVTQKRSQDAPVDPDGAQHRLECCRAVTDQYEVFGYERKEIVAKVPDNTDANDWHVNAAALSFQSSLEDGKASIYVVSANTRHLAVKQMAAQGITVIKPGPFIDMLYEKSPYKVLRAMKQVIKDLKDPPYTVEQLIAALKLHGAKQTAAAFETLQARK
jgi:hypothetical protein